MNSFKQNRFRRKMSGTYDGILGRGKRLRQNCLSKIGGESGDAGILKEAITCLRA